MMEREKESKLDLDELFENNSPQEIMKKLQPFSELIMHYECALMEIETKFKVLNAEFSLQYERNPFESIKTRIKQPLSIVEKLKRMDKQVSVENVESYLNDVAGVRVICSFPEDIYTLAELISQQDDIRVLTRKDYIQNPKPNGYRSLHLILEVPIFLSDRKLYMKVEVQFRTIAMDFWASLEHKLKYKKDVPNADAIAAQLKRCAQVISDMDYEMQVIRNEIEPYMRGGL